MNFTILFLFILISGYNTARLSLMFIFDTSQYIRKDDFWRVKIFVKAVIKFFHITPNHVRVSVITYSTMKRNDFTLNTYKDLRQVLNAVTKIPYERRQKYTYRALFYARELSLKEQFGARAGVMNVAIAITNGKFNRLLKTVEEARLLKQENVKVFVVAIGTRNVKIEEKIASIPSQWFIVKVPNYKLLKSYSWTLAFRIYWGKY